MGLTVAFPEAPTYAGASDFSDKNTFIRYSIRLRIRYMVIIPPAQRKMLITPLAQK